ncbi:MAG: deoxyribonuclease IV, partial [Planctomycetota bacterium]
GLERAAACVRAAVKTPGARRVTVLLENTAGQGTNLGHRLEHLAELLRLAASGRVGVCLDTCHLYAAGYDLKSEAGYEKTFREADDLFGLERVKAFHLNDSKTPCGSRVDRHEHIGKGTLGSAAFRRLVQDARFQALPALLETPGGPEGYARDLRNLARLRKMRKTA